LDVIIRNVPSKAYREFKSRAAKVGLRLGDALKEAMEEWGTESEGAKYPPHDENDDAYRRMKASLQKDYWGKYVGISGGQLVAVAETLDALGAVLRRKRIMRCRTVHVGVEESGEGGEWLWGSIVQEIASPTTAQ
jgi:hypothetical protein